MSDTRPNPHSGPDLVGAVLGSYQILSEISTGGMGTVYRAQHVLLGRPAAVKLLHPELTTNQELVERFVIEAKAATAIRHPGIVEVYEFGYAEDGRAFLVMEFLDGEPLSHRLARGRLTEVEAATFASGIASALKAAHAKGIIHRDLKPDNVFLIPDADGGLDRTKVLDFGIAKLADAAPQSLRHTQTGALMGTPLYMAPEQARAAGTIDHRADLYSLGCILYEMLVGQPPFVADGAGEIIALQMFTPPQPPSQRLETITPEMEQLVLRLLEKEPHARIQSAAEVRNILTTIGTRLLTRLSAPFAALMPSGGPEMLSGPQIAAPEMLAGPLPHGGALGWHGEAPPELAPAKRSSMPIIAGAITVLAIAGAAIAFVVARSGDSSTASVEPTKSDPTTVAPTKPTVPTIATPVKPAEPAKPVQTAKPVEVAKPVAPKPVDVKPPVAAVAPALPPVKPTAKPIAKPVTPPKPVVPAKPPVQVAKHPPPATPPAKDTKTAKAPPGKHPAAAPPGKDAKDPKDPKDPKAPQGPVTKPDNSGAIVAPDQVDPGLDHTSNGSPVETNVKLDKKPKPTVKPPPQEPPKEPQDLTKQPVKPPSTE